MKNYKLLLLAVIALSLTGLKAYGQTLPTLGYLCGPVIGDCNNPVITMPPSSNLCPGTTFNFSPTVAVPSGYTFTSYNWSAPAGVPPLLTPTWGTTLPASASVTVNTVCATYTLTITAMGTTDLIYAGSFGSFINDGLPGACTDLECMKTTYHSHGTCAGSTTGTDYIGINGTGGMSPSSTWCVPSENGHTPYPFDWTYSLCVHSRTLSPALPAGTIPYFWGEIVYLCPNSDYVLTYYARPYAISNANSQPAIQVLLGTTDAARGTNSLERAHAGGIEQVLGTNTIGPLSGGCNSPSGYWQPTTILFHTNSSISGPTFICMYNAHYSSEAAQFAIDDITLHRIGVTIQGINVCPAAPAATINSDPVACVATNFAFTVTGHSGDRVYYNYTSPGCSTVHSSGLVSGGSLTVTVPGSCITTVGGMVCLNVTSITTTTATSGGGPASCTFPVPQSKCVPITNGPTAGTITPVFVCIPPSTSFTVTTTSVGGTSFNWEIGADGTASASFAGSTPPTSSTATIDVTGPGTVIMTCTVTNICGHTVSTETVTVNAAPEPIAGPLVVCAGSSIILTDMTTGGTWSCSNTALATIIATGSINSMVTAAAVTVPGIVTITYTLPSGCTETKRIMVNPMPFPLSGPQTICPNSHITLTDGLTGGVWSSSNNSIASVRGVPPISADVFSVGMPGSVIITYNVAGCIVTTTITVNQPPPITGPPPYMCAGSTITLSDAGTGGGTWTSGSTGVATVTPGPTGGGVVTGVSAGTSVITFTSAIAGCTALETVTVNPIPTLTGPKMVCIYSSITISSDVGGGVWSSSNTGIATVVAGTPATGIVTGAAVGTVVITYISGAGCMITKTIAVDPLPAVITGPADVCRGSTITLSDVTPGFWTSTNTAIAIVGSASGIVTGISFGTVTIDYTSVPEGCTVGYVVVIKDTPIVDMTTVPFAYVGCPIILESHGGIGTISGGSVITSISWSSSNTGIATVFTTSISVLNTWAIFTPIATGTVTVTFSATNDCGTGSMSYTTVVLPVPVVSITSPGGICAGTTISLVSAPGGGTWSSSNTHVATITATGDATGINPGGTSVLTYTLPYSACYTTGTTTLTVNRQPGPITGIKTICTAGGTTTLSDRITGGVWTSNDAGIATVDPITGVVTAASTTGSVTITYTLPGSCYSTTTVRVFIGAPDCVCDYIANHPNVVVNELEPGHTGVLTSSPTPGGYYYLNHDISIDPLSLIIMRDNVVVISPGVQIWVNSVGKLVLEHSHLFCCPGYMWKGIALSTYLPHAGTGGGLGTPGQLALINNANGSTMIEDAKIAVSAPCLLSRFASFVPGDLLLTLYCNGATFNKDSVGILIAGTPMFGIIPTPGDPLSDHPGYPFVIENTVFTSRNFYPYTTLSTSGTLEPWPIAWPDNILGLAPLKGPVLPILVPPYAPYGVDLYPSALCNSGARSFCGVDLVGVGAIDVPGTYSSVVVGSAYTTSPMAMYNGKNVFDNMHYGILARNSNVVSRNSVYMNMDPGGAYSNPGTGIYSYRDAAGGTNQYALDVYGTANGYHNEFYNCKTDVKAEDLYHVRGIYSQMNARHLTSVPMDLQGWYGYDVTVSQYDRVELDYNTINNIKTGISSYVVAPAAGTGPLFVGQMSASHNTISARPGGGVPAHNEYTHTGIDVEATVPPYTGGTIPGCEINIDHNTIDHAYNGIVLMNFDGPGEAIPVKTTIHNTITIAEDVMSGDGVIPYYTQEGILHDNNNKDWIEENVVTGPGAHTPTPPTPYYAVVPGNNIIEGIHCSAQGLTNICSNTVQNINTGFYFDGYQTVEIWDMNTMQGNAYGYIQAGAMGPQPDAFGGYITGNYWGGTWGGAYTGGGHDWQTYTIGSPIDLTSGAGTPMEVSGISPGQDPIYNYADGPFPFITDRYGFGTGSGNGITVDPTGLNPEACFTVPPTSMPSEYRHTHNSNIVPSSYNYVARKKMGYVANAANKNWIAQMALWHAIADDVSVDTSALLHAFKQMAINSRYKNLMDIESEIGKGHYDAATTMLNSQIGYMASTDSDAATGAVLADSAGDNVVANYRQYYQLVVKYRTSMLSSDDTANVVTLANKCPTIDGSVIYDARAFYNHIFHDSRIFNDAGCEAADSSSAIDVNGGSHGGTQDDSGQVYTLWPNPSNGNITITQKIPDGPAMAEVWNSIGQKLYRGQLYFTSGVAHLIIHTTPGVYMLQLIDADGKRFILKFVISDR